MKVWEKVLFALFYFSLSTYLKEPIEGYRGLASSWAIIPSHSLAGLHYIFKGYSYSEEEDSVLVTGPVVEITQDEKTGWRVYPEGFTSEIDPEDFEDEQLLGRAVFEAVTGSGATVGTAFLVGNKVVLTNRHIMNIPPKAKKEDWECGKFSIRLNHKDESVDCERVRFCSSKFDYCVVEIEKMANGAYVGTEIRTLRLAKRVRTNKNASLLHIGNAAGLGLQASRGRGVIKRNGEFHHNIPTLGGSSGAPIFDRRNEVIGMNWGRKGEGYVDDESYNRGVLSETIYKELRLVDPETLKEIKSFRSWHRRAKHHRSVKIESPSH